LFNQVDQSLNNTNVKKESVLLANLIGLKEFKDSVSINLNLFNDNEVTEKVVGTKGKQMEEMQLTTTAKLEPLLEINKEFLLEDKKESDQSNELNLDLLSLVDQ